MCKKSFPQTALKTLYYALIHCHLVYAVEIWSCTAQSNLKQLSLKQKNAIRIISGEKYNAHTEHLFKKHEILPLNLLSDCMKIKFMQNAVQKFLPFSFSNIWLKNRERRMEEGNQQIELRNYDDFYPTLKTGTILPLPPLKPT